MSEKQSQNSQHSRPETRASSNTGSPAQTPSAHLDKTSFDKAKAILDGKHGFGGALWDAQLRVASDSKKKIEAAQVGAKKTISNECLHILRESMVAEIQRWAPQYADLATAYPQFAKPDSVQWTHDQMWTVIKRRLRKSDLDGAVAWCLITMTGGNVLKKDTWRPPDWASAGSALSFIQNEHEELLLRLDYALEQALARLEIKGAIRAGQTHKQRKSNEADRRPFNKRKARTLRPDDAEIAENVRIISDEIVPLREAMRREGYGNFGPLRSSKGKENLKVFQLIDTLLPNRQVEAQQMLMDGLRSKQVEALAENLIALRKGVPVARIHESCYRYRISRREVECSESSETAKK